MRSKIFSEATMPTITSLAKIFFITAILGIFIFAIPKAGIAQQKKVDKYQINLKSRSITPQLGIEKTFRDSLTVQLQRGEKRHVIA